MAQAARFLLGAAVGGVGFYALRNTIWTRSQRTVAGFQAVQAEIPGSHPVSSVELPKVPVLQDEELGRAVRQTLNSAWNWAVMRSRSGAVALIPQREQPVAGELGPITKFMQTMDDKR